MDTNVFFYTFSTIAQALAGAVALLAAFVLFKLQNIDTSLRASAVHVLGSSSQTDNRPDMRVAWFYFAHGRWNDLIDAIPPDYPLSDFQRVHVQIIKARAMERIALVKPLKVAVPMTLITLVLAVFVLAFIPALYSPWVARIGTIVFAACVISYWPVIAAMFK